MSRREKSDDGARLPIDKEAFTVLLKADRERFIGYQRSWAYSNDKVITIPVRRFDVPALQALKEHLQARSSIDRWLVGQVSAHIAALSSPDTVKIKQLRALETALRAWVLKDALRGWIFRRVSRTEGSTALQPYLVKNVVYVEASLYNPACVRFELLCWNRSKHRESIIRFDASDLKDAPTVTQLLLDSEITHENEMVLGVYDRGERKFLDWRKQLGEQFVGTGCFYVQHPDSEERYSDKDAHDLRMGGTRLVIDDPAGSIENHAATMLLRYIDGDDSGDSDSGKDSEDADRFTQVPIDCEILCFNLSSHRAGWAHVEHIKPYVYRPELRQKLILPLEHADLIDALSADMDVLQEDVVEGKSGGTTIMCQGTAGTGKTLTAEVYAEVIQRPLYRVHSGQLGTDAESVEQALQTALSNASRWRAVLLIDEADVFVMERGNDLEMNAVVGVFLRTLEYYPGLLFMTTNRLDTIDEAILSRCIAIIKYEKPAMEERKRLWETLGEQYGYDGIKDEKTALKLAQTFVCTGRDIKGLLRLTMKYARQRGKAQPVLADFIRLSAFKGIEVKVGK